MTRKYLNEAEWNIRAARELWSRNHDFSDWPHCDQPFRTTPPPADQESADG